MDTTSTIVAISTPPGDAPRGMVRISGPRTQQVVESMLIDGTWKRGAAPARLSLGNTGLPVMLSISEAPNSYTAEDTAEFQAPGNSRLLNRMVDACLQAGADHGLDVRRAEAGEFTARAFLNGRISLLDAEAVAITIGAQSDAELRAATMLRVGGLGEFCQDVADNLADALALVEAGIDFTDQEDVIPIGSDELSSLLRALHGGIGELLSRAVGLEVIQAIPHVVLSGAANAGKSTLFNALLGRERAVISSVAGTTRDALCEPLVIHTHAGDAEVMLIDVAGTDDADDSTLGTRMRAAADRARSQAQLVLHCIPPDGSNDRTPTEGTLAVHTKVDLHPHDGEGLGVSAVTGDGMPELMGAIASRLSDHAVSLSEDTVALQHRHESALRAASDGMREALAILAHEKDKRIGDVELVAASLRTALDELGALVGAHTPDDVLGRIFASFCVGK